jgi:prepilin-type processing-associated H-X9-DG protein
MYHIHRKTDHGIRRTCRISAEQARARDVTVAGRPDLLNVVLGEQIIIPAEQAVQKGRDDMGLQASAHGRKPANVCTADCHVLVLCWPQGSDVMLTMVLKMCVRHIWKINAKS